MSSVAGLLRPPSFDRGVQSRSAASALGALALAFAGLAGASMLDGRLPLGRLSLAVPPTEPLLGLLLDPSPIGVPVAGPNQLTGAPGVPVVVAAATLEASPLQPAPPTPFAPPRPLALQSAGASGSARLAEKPLAAPGGTRPPAATPAANGLFEPLFGLKRPDPAETVTAGASPPGPAAAIPSQLALVPFPPPRPLDLARAAAPAPARLADRARPGRTRAEPPVAAPDNRGFFERLFGINRPATPATALAYAPAASAPLGRSLGLASSLPLGGGGTAVYDIAAHTVTLPDGRRLEAHSGLGSNLDDPGSVHLRMRGATPPHTYELSLREKLFHGVRALRLTPVGDGHIFGRDGLLAHTYMLGPNGQSNGCVSFRDYQAFLQAFERGDVRRLVVVGRS